MPNTAPKPLEEKLLLTDKQIAEGVKRVSDAIYNDLDADHLVPTEAAAAVVESFKPNEVVYTDRDGFLSFVKRHLYDDVLYHNKKAKEAVTAVAKKRAKNEEEWFKGDTTVRSRAVVEQILKSNATRLVLLDDHGRLLYSILTDLKSKNKELYETLEIVAVSIDESCTKWQENFFPKEHLTCKCVDVFSEEFGELLADMEGNQTVFYFSFGSLDAEGRSKFPTLLNSEPFEKACVREGESIFVFVTVSTKGQDAADARRFIQEQYKMQPAPIWLPKLWFGTDFVPTEDKVFDYIRHGEGKAILSFAGSPLES